VHRRDGHLRGWAMMRRLALIGLTSLFFGAGVFPAENRHGLVYSVWFVTPGPDDPEVPPLTVQDQVRYCGAAEEWSRRIWEVTDGSHLIYQVHFYSGYEDAPPSNTVEWRRWKDTPNANCTGKCFFMFDTLKGCAKDFAFVNGELTASLGCTGQGQVCSSDDAADAREATCLIDGEPFPTPTAEVGWVLAHENAHSHYNLFDEYVPDASSAVYKLYHVCVGEEDNQGTEHTSMMAKRLRNHFCDASTHVSERPVRNLAGEIVVDNEGQPFMAQNPNHPNGAWVDALESEWVLHPLEFSGTYDNVPDFPGLPVPHIDHGGPVTFCVWHFEGDGQPINDALVLLDKSGSMGFRHPAYDDGPTALEAAVKSARSFYNWLRDDRLGGILAFDTDLTELVAYGTKADDAPSFDVGHGGSTDLCRAIREGGDAVKAEAPTADFGGGQQILLSDGRPTVPGCNTDAEVLVATMDACDGGLEGVGVATNTVAFGDADRELLRQVAGACGAQTTALLVPTSEVEIEGQVVQRSTPLQIRTALTRTGRFTRKYHEVLNRNAPLAPARDDAFVVPPGTSELAVEWMGDGFEHLFFSDLNVIDCRFSQLDFQLVRPNGTIVTDGDSPVAGELEDEVRTIRVEDPMPGVWRARIVLDDEFICHPGFGGTHTWGDYDPRVAVVASVRAASILPSMQVTPVVAPRDVPVAIKSSIVLSGSAQVTGISVSADVIDANGASESVALFDDGTHGDETGGDGIYTGTFNADRAAMAPGGYRVVVMLASQAQHATSVAAGETALELAGGPLPSPPDATFTMEDSFVYRDCEFGNGLSGNTCGDSFAVPSDPPPAGSCAISLPPGTSRKGIEIETRGIPLGERWVRVSGGVGVRVRNVETVGYDAPSKLGLVRFDAEATPHAPDELRHFRVSFAGQWVSTRDCRLPLEPSWEYASKLVCGVQPDTRNMQLARGFYATTINVRNPQSEPVSFEKVLSLTIPPGRQKPGRVLPVAIDTLQPQQALAVDCDDIRERVFEGKLPGSFIEGYVVVRSERQLDVTGVYSTATLNAEGSAEDHSAIHLERTIGRRLVKRDDDEPPRADLVIDDNLPVDANCGPRLCQVALRFTVRNIGAAAAGPFTVDIGRSDTGASLIAVPIPGGLAAGASFTGTSTVQYVFQTGAPREICIKADAPADNIAESNENNNERCINL
jgi:hypothetical protein